MGTNLLTSSFRPCFVKASPTVEKAISCYRADRLVDKFPQHLVAFSRRWQYARISRCRARTLRTRSRTGVCEPLMPDVVAPKAHQNNRSYVSSGDLPSTQEFSMVGGYTGNPEKPQNCRNWGVGACPGQYGSHLPANSHPEAKVT